jgi:hypothetical protein
MAHQHFTKYTAVKGRWTLIANKRQTLGKRRLSDQIADLRSSPCGQKNRGSRRGVSQLLTFIFN